MTRKAELDRLREEFRNIATTAGYTATCAQTFHWQIRDGKRVIVNAWPTTGKLRGEKTLTILTPDHADFIEQVRKLVEDYVPLWRQFEAVARYNSPRGNEPSQVYAAKSESDTRTRNDSETLETCDDDASFSEAGRYADVTMSLDGDELRVIFTGFDYCQSVRMDPVSSLRFLQEATKLLEELKKHESFNKELPF